MSSLWNGVSEGMIGDSENDIPNTDVVLAILEYMHWSYRKRRTANFEMDAMINRNGRVIDFEIEL